MDDFLYMLRLGLEDRLPKEEVNRQIGLYESYISECLAGGEPLERVLRRLGDPMAVADLVVDNFEKNKGANEETKTPKSALEEPFSDRRNVFGGRIITEDGEEEDWNSADFINSRIQNPNVGIKAEFKENEGWDIRLGKLKLNSWYGTLLILIIVVIIGTLLGKLH